MSVCLSASLSVCLNVCHSVCLNICLFVWLSVSRSVLCPSVRWSICMYISIFVWLSINMCAFFCLPACQRTFLFISLIVWLSYNYLWSIWKISNCNLIKSIIFLSVLLMCIISWSSKQVRKRFLLILKIQVFIHHHHHLMVLSFTEISTTLWGSPWIPINCQLMVIYDWP